MSVKSAPYYWVECDGCGTRCDYGDYAAWGEADHAVDMATESEWTTAGGRHHCPDCASIAECDGCGALVDDKEAGERDMLCPACWAKADAVPA